MGFYECYGRFGLEHHADHEVGNIFGQKWDLIEGKGLWIVVYVYLWSEKEFASALGEQNMQKINHIFASHHR